MFLKKITFSVCTLFLLNANAQTFTNYTIAEGLASNNVLCVDVDASDNLWFGTQFGISKFDGTTWTTFDTGTYPIIPDDNIQAIFIDSNGDTWVGTDFGISMYNGTTWTTYTSADGLGNEQIKCIGEDATGKMWFGTSNGVSTLDGSTWTNYGTSDGIPFGGVNSITLHTNGEVWLGTGLSGIRIFDGIAFNPIQETEGLISNKIRAIAIGTNGKKWVGTADGITTLTSQDVFSKNHTTIFTLPAPDTLNPIEDVKIDGNGLVWAGIYVDYLVTEGGVSVYTGSQWIQFDVNDGLVGPVVRALAIDSNNDVWVATSTGVSKISETLFLSIQSQEKEVSFNIYPNPTSDYITIQFQNVNTQNTIDIYDVSMKLIKSVSVDSQSEITIPVSELTSGIYFANINGQAKRFVVK
jgi:ligand-binding sensor domain-containing protein